MGLLLLLYRLIVKHKMETHLIKYFMLNKNELTYEVLIRGGEPASNVLGLRKQINKLILLVPNDDILESGIEAKEDCDGVRVSLNELASKITSLEDKYDNNLFQRATALHNHIYHRLRRIDVTDTSHASVIKAIQKKFNSLSRKMNQFKNNQPAQSATSEHTNYAPQTSSLEGPSVVTVQCDHTKFSDFKIKYDGRSCVHAFVQRINEYKTARNLSSEKLLMYASEIFTGNALHWYRGMRDSVTSWDDLIVQLVSDFSPFDYDYRLMTEIRSRTQGEQENITIYFAIMSELFSRLTTPITEQEKLQILLHNIRPCYSPVLASYINGIDSIATLRKICLNSEKIQCLSSQFREPPKSTNTTMAPDLAYTRYESKAPFFKNNYGSSERKTFHNSYDREYKSNNNFTPVVAIESKPGTSTAKAQFCPRCRSTEHSLKECKQERYPICFKCGLKEHTFPNCPNCQSTKPSKN